MVIIFMSFTYSSQDYYFRKINKIIKTHQVAIFVTKITDK
jgi:hypothetical protein